MTGIFKNRPDIFRLEDTIWIAECKTNIPAYDFAFYPLFVAGRSFTERILPCVARVGAIPDYDILYGEMKKQGHILINDPAQHRRASVLSEWYPLINDLTPKSRVYDSFPELATVLEAFTFPLFIKGDRQTSGHNPALSVAHNEHDFEYIQAAYKQDSILHWQPVVVREYMPLQKAGEARAGQMQLSFEFRSFWWKNKLVGCGHYWSQFTTYHWTGQQQHAALSLAAEAAARIHVPFLVIDLALTETGKWIIIECNDAQESGYCGVDKASLWRNIILLEQNNSSSHT